VRFFAHFLAARQESVKAGGLGAARPLFRIRAVAAPVRPCTMGEGA
jgi:hypothetical protein